MDFIKKLGIGAYLGCLAIVTIIVGLIVFGIATGAGNGLEIASGSQPFYDFTRPEDALMKGAVVALGIVAIILVVASVAVALAPKSLVTTFVGGCVRIVLPAVLMLTILAFVYGSFTGLGWTYFSNEELEIFDEAKAVGGQVITGIVFFAIAWVASLAATFFPVVND